MPRPGPRRGMGSVEATLARLAGSQHGLVTRRELLRAGVSDDEIRSRRESGALLRAHPGVYSVGHRGAGHEPTYLAAVLACGKGARLSGAAAAYYYGLIAGDPPAPEVLASTKRRLKDVLAHRGLPDSRDVTVWRGIPITTVARALVDIAASMTEDALARAFHEAHVRFRTTPSEVEAVLARRPTSPGAGKLRRVIHADVPVILSRLERAFRDLLAAEGLPLPVTNQPVGAHWVDCRWPERRLTVELDSYRYHATRRGWEDGRRRERDARERGEEFRRFVWGDVVEAPAPMLRDLRRLLR